MITHIPVMIITVLPASIFPELSLSFTPLFNDKFIDLFLMFHTKFSDVFVPYLPLLSHKVPDLATGVLTFLQWDLYVGATALLLWAVLLHQNAKSEKKDASLNTSSPFHNDLLLGGIVRRHVSLRILVWMMVSGPMGALTVLLWERDSMIGQKIKQ